MSELKPVKMPDDDAIYEAAEWLRVNEGPNNEAEGCEAVANWIEYKMRLRWKNTLTGSNDD